MSREHVEVVRQALEAWQRDDFETWVAALDPAIEWYTVLEKLVEGLGSVYRGTEGMRKFWTAYRTELDDFQIEGQELRDLGDDRVLLLGHFRWRGPASGIEVGSPLGLVMTLREGKVIHSSDYLSHEEALEAVGLRE